MLKTLLVGTGILVAIYLGVSHATEGGMLLNSASTAYNSGVRVLQGRG
jgi:hypothetical protein